MGCMLGVFMTVHEKILKYVVGNYGKGYEKRKLKYKHFRPSEK